MSEEELTQEELEQAAGGRRTKMSNKPLSGPSTAVPKPPTGPVSDGEPIPDPGFVAPVR